MARASYSTTPLLRSLVHRPQGVILVRNVYEHRWHCELSLKFARAGFNNVVTTALVARTWPGQQQFSNTVKEHLGTQLVYCNADPYLATAWDWDKADKHHAARIKEAEVDVTARMIMRLGMVSTRYNPCNSCVLRTWRWNRDRGFRRTKYPYSSFLSSARSELLTGHCKHHITRLMLVHGRIL